ncbi:hypothetical protein NMA510612_2464 [Neisseria meningitidis]|uniref:Uncharacterized protein n=1 Tax=Neisseria meningitidis TaxID=487 RepID=X5EM44_NEIME|nr:hypothetical protein NMA510612_2464 [Neisseria meningitidis]
MPSENLFTDFQTALFSSPVQTSIRDLCKNSLLTKFDA